MGRKGEYGSGRTSRGWDWGDYPPASRPIRTKKGIALSDRTGKIAKTWWSRRWIAALESFGWSSRLQRGRSYARAGQVLDLKVTAEGVTARVQGSRPNPYVVTLSLAPVHGEVWERIARALSVDAGLIAQLLAGEVPEAIEEIFGACGAALLPRSARDIHTDCTCPDTANPCKHIAAVHYLLSERLDQDPFLVFLLRGKDREEVVASLRGPALPEPSSGGDGPGAGTREEAAPRPSRTELMAWWTPGPRFAAAACSPHEPAVEMAVLKRLGEPSFCTKSQAVFLDTGLRQVYRIVSNRALAAAEGLPVKEEP